MTDAITREERDRIRNRDWPAQYALATKFVLADDYEAALTAAEAREAEKDARIRELEEALRQIAEAHHMMIEPDLRRIARAALEGEKP